MKDCRDCLHRKWWANGGAWVCDNPAVVNRHEYEPRCNIERIDGLCGPEAKYFKDKRDI
jgi:hypothetical protein